MNAIKKQQVESDVPRAVRIEINIINSVQGTIKSNKCMCYFHATFKKRSILKIVIHSSEHGNASGLNIESRNSKDRHNSPLGY